MKYRITDDFSRYGYYFFDPNENKVFVARMAIFLEKEFLLQEASGREIKLDENPEEGQSSQAQLDEPEPVEQVTEQPEAQISREPRRSGRIRRQPERYDGVYIIDHDEPLTYADAVSGPESARWLEAMRAEMDSMSDNQVWDLVDPPPGVIPAGNPFLEGGRNP